MNKNVLVSILMFIGFIQPLFSQSQQIKSEILSNMKKQEDSWNQGKLTDFMQFYWQSDSLLFIGSSGPQYGWGNTLERYEKAYPNRESMGKLKFENIQFKALSDDHVHLSGSWKLIRNEGDLSGYYSLLWKEIEGEWKIIYDHSSLGKEE